MQNKFLRTSILFGLKLKNEQQEKIQKESRVGVNKAERASKITRGQSGLFVEDKGPKRVRFPD